MIKIKTIPCDSVFNKIWNQETNNHNNVEVWSKLLRASKLRCKKLSSYQCSDDVWDLDLNSLLK